MKYVALLAACMLLALAGCAVAVGPAPTPKTVYVVVTPTTKPYAAPQKASGGVGAPAGSPAARHIAALRSSGWLVDDIDQCRDGDCAALYQECSYILVYFSPVTGVVSSIGYGVDFSDHTCDDGAYMADIQDAALRTLDAEDAMLWVYELAYNEQAPDIGESVEDVCGDAYCTLEMDTDSFLMLTVFYR